MKRRLHASIDESKEIIEMTSLLGDGMYGKVYETGISSSSKKYATKILIQEGRYDYYMPSVIRDIMIGGSACKMRKGLIEFLFKTKSYATISVQGFCTLHDLAPSIIPPSAAKILARCILRQLSDLHSMGVIHRDIKPANIVLDSCWPPNVYIIDFGISTVQSKSHETSVVSLWWRSPEVLYKFYHTSAVDIWSFGAILVGLTCKEFLVKDSCSKEAKISIWKKLGYPEKEEWQDLYDVNGMEYHGEAEGFHCVYPDILETLKSCLTPNPLNRKSAEQLLQMDFFTSEITDCEIKESKEWFMHRLKEVNALKELQREPIKYEEGKHFEFCYKFESSFVESEALYAKNVFEFMTPAYLSMLQKMFAELYFNYEQAENTVILMDRTLCGNISFMSLNPEGLVVAVIYVACSIFTDICPDLTCVKDLAKCTSSIEQLKAFVDVVMKSCHYRFVTNDLKNFVRKNSKFMEWAAQYNKNGS